MSQTPPEIPPMRVLPLTSPATEMAARSLSAQFGQPGVVRFIAIGSIVVASLSILVSAGAGFMDFSLIVAAASSNATASSGSSIAGQGPRIRLVTNISTERVPARGLNYFDRQMFANGLERVRPLSADQLSQLDELLAERGKIVSGNKPVPAPEQFGASVTRSGHTGSAGSKGSDYFETALGRLELSDNRAVFFPTGGQPAIHSNVIAIPSPTFGATPGSLQPEQIRSIVRTVNELNGSKIKSAQLKTLVATLQSPGQKFIVPTSDGSDPANQIAATTTLSDGTLQVDCAYRTISSQFLCDASGLVVPPAAAVTAPVIDEDAGVAAVSANFAELVVAIFLLVTGILTLRFSPRGRQLHWIYVGVKLPIAIASGVLSAWMWSTLISSGIAQTTAGSPAPAATSTIAGVMMGVVPALFGCVWPIALIFLLVRRNVRLYYGSGVPR